MSRIHDALERARREPRRPTPPAEGLPSLAPQGSVAGQDYPLPEMAECFIEECQTLRSALEVALPDRSQRVVMFTSSVRGEGCTTLLASLGYVLASRGGLRVCIVDANIKWPSLGSLAGFGHHAGLTDVVGRDLDLASALRSTPTPNLHVLPCGNTPLISSEVFGSSKMAALLETLQRHHAYVLLDTPAVMPVPEVVMQCKTADGVVVVARANKTDRTVVQKARDLLVENGANLLGVVLNRRRFVIPEFLYRRL